MSRYCRAVVGAKEKRTLFTQVSSLISERMVSEVCSMIRIVRCHHKFEIRYQSTLPHLHLGIACHLCTTVTDIYHVTS